MLSKIKKTFSLFLVFFLAGFLQVLSATAETQEQLYHSAERLMEDGFYDEAKGQFEKVADLDPGNEMGLSARLKISDVYFQQSRFEAALQIAEKVVAENPDSYDAQFHLACAFAKVKRYEETAQAFAKTVELRPEEGLGLVGQGLAVFGKGDVAPAVQIILQAKDLFKKKRNIPWHRNVRIMVNQMKNFEKYPPKFANLWLENNFKLVYETYAEFIFHSPIEK
ncbi:MAG: hypothetical protein COV66_01910 [Nitrospinae bacterium CG11_big_fil_rev_8_21_14_0_20_45_15]|nr:MAG: hypothetical protein COV66_01910 [Nitrospinae bacterium CG11_big_fil_rev_8_21_14_0_20_45_15]